MRQIMVWLLVLCVAFNPYASMVFGGVEGAEVVSGQATFQQSGNITTITASNGTIVNYSSFNISQLDVGEFVQCPCST